MSAAQELGEDDDAEWIKNEYESFKSCLDSSINSVMKSRGLYFVPTGPYKGFDDTTIIGSVASLWPTKVLAINDLRALGTLWRIYKHYLAEGGFLHWDIWGSIGSYLTIHVAHNFLFLGYSSNVLRLLNWLLDHQAAPAAWPEGITTDRCRRGYMGDIPHGWASAEYIPLLRGVLLYEDQGKLHIAPGVPTSWLEDGNEITVRNAPTHWVPCLLK